MYSIIYIYIYINIYIYILVYIYRERESVCKRERERARRERGEADPSQDSGLTCILGGSLEVKSLQYAGAYSKPIHRTVGRS